MSKHWIQKAIKHPGALRAKAAAAGESTHAFAESHEHSSGKVGAMSRLALTLMKMHHKGHMHSDAHHNKLVHLQANHQK